METSKHSTMKTINYTKKKKEFVKLWTLQNQSQKAIAQKLNVSEVTICKWTKQIKADFNLLKDTRTKIIKRLNHELTKANPTSTDIHNYSTAISTITKQIKDLLPV